MASHGLLGAASWCRFTAFVVILCFFAKAPVLARGQSSARQKGVHWLGLARERVFSAFFSC